MQKQIGRNDPCHCGSGKKYKKCCYKTDKGPKKIKAKLLSPKTSPLANLVSNSLGQSATVEDSNSTISSLKDRIGKGEVH